MEILTLLVAAALKHGAIGLLAVMGWSLAGWFLWRDYRKKEKSGLVLVEKDKLIAQKDKQLLDSKEELVKTIASLSKDRINDLKEISEDYNKVANTTIHTLDKLATALNVVNHIK